MTERDPLGRESYNELMNEWADTRNAMLRMQGGILHPPAYLSPVARLFGYLWRIVVVLVVLVVGAFLLLRSHIKSADFSDMVGAKIGVMLKSSEVEISPFRWKRSTGSSKRVNLKSSDESFYLSELTAEGFRFKLPFGMLMKPKWEVEEVFVADLTADIRPGSGGTGDPVVADMNGKWGVSPDLSQLSFDSVEVADANLNWGLVSTARGALKNASLQVLKEEGIWQLLVSKGKLSQNYLRGLSLSSLKVKFHEGEIAFSEGAFTMGEDGTGTLEGTISTGEYPEFDLKLRLDNCDIATVLPKYTGEEIARMTPEEESLITAIEAWRQMLMGRITGVIQISGSSNSAAGIKTVGTLRFSEDQGQTLRILSIPLFSDLGGLTGSGHLRRPLITGGTLTFVTSEGMFSASAIDLQLGQSARLTGEFSYGVPKTQKKAPGSTPPVVPGVPILEEAAVVPIPEFSGVVQFGVIPAALTGIPPAVQAEFFPTSRDGMIWMDLPLEGTLKQVTAERGRKLVDATKAADQ